MSRPRVRRTVAVRRFRLEGARLNASIAARDGAAVRRGVRRVVRDQVDLEGAVRLQQGPQARRACS